MLRGAERVKRSFFALGAAQSLPCWEPAVDVFERGDELRLLVAVPGVLAAAIEISLDEGSLTIRGQRPIPAAARRAVIHRLEIPYGRFERRIALPPGNFRLAGSCIEDGFLTLTLHRQ